MSQAGKMGLFSRLGSNSGRDKKTGFGTELSSQSVNGFLIPAARVQSAVYPLSLQKPSLDLPAGCAVFHSLSARPSANINVAFQSDTHDHKRRM